MMELITGPVGMPVTVEKAKERLRVDHSDHDGMIADMIAAATARLDGPDGILGRALLPQTWRASTAFFCPVMRLPLAPVISVDVVDYLDGDGVRQEFEDFELGADAKGPLILPLPDATWPETGIGLDAVRVTFQAGFSGTVPAPITEAILMDVAANYDDMKLDRGEYNRRVSPYRRMRL